MTNLDTEKMPGTAVINAYHDLSKVEVSFWMTESDLKARPVFHDKHEVIEAHLTKVFAALDTSRHPQDSAG